MLRRHQLIAVALLAATVGGARGTAYGLDPLAVVREIARLDGAGARLSPVEWRKVAPLVEWPGQQRCIRRVAAFTAKLLDLLPQLWCHGKPFDLGFQRCLNGARVIRG